MSHDRIAVLDFGGQYAHLIANRVRRLGVYSEIKEPDTPADQLRGFKGVILSGGPNSVYEKGAPHCDPKIFGLGVPVLGICYGHQLMQHLLGGMVSPGQTKEYGMAEIQISPTTPLPPSLEKEGGIFDGVPKKTRVWMSHGDTVTALAPGFQELASSRDLANSAVGDLTRHLYGVQFHVEVTHTEQGMTMLSNFLFKVCRAKKSWDMKYFVQAEVAAIAKKVGDKKVFLLVSGGVDSAVAFALLEKALGANRVFGLMVDTGLMRLDEAKKVKRALAAAGFKNLHVADKRDLFLNALKGVTEPEAKRKIIGDLFWTVKEQVAEELRLNPDEWIVAQGTIYPDTIETGGTKHADKIKTHHNRVDLMQELIRQGRVIEPLEQLYKDEVRELGAELGLPAEIVQRQPFPGPGLGVRILCVSEEEEKAQGTFEELNARIEMFLKERFGALAGVGARHALPLRARVLPIKSVGVQGDGRTYRHPVALFFGADTDPRFHIDWDVLEQISTAITNRFAEVNRVVLAVGGASLTTPLPPSLEKEGGGGAALRIRAAGITPSRVALLQRVDDVVQNMMRDHAERFHVWQFPVVLMPLDGESVVLRPVESTEAMTAKFARIEDRMVDGIVDRIVENKEISHVFYDLTHKPPGTIEWE